MSLFNYPHTDFHELNLDWVIGNMKELVKEWSEFVATNSIVMADPITHDINTGYAIHTIVISESGNVYISLQSVPKGVQITNADYWMPVFNYEAFIQRFTENLTVNYYRDEYRAKTNLVIGDWVALDDVLYEVTANITTGALFDIGVNIQHVTIEDLYNRFTASAMQLINQYKNDIDASELAYKNQLSATIANTTASLQAQLDAAIAGATVDSEVINARVGADGVTYSTLGNAVRNQFTLAYNTVRALLESTKSIAFSFMNMDLAEAGGTYWSAFGVKASTPQTDWSRYPIFALPAGTYYCSNIPYDYCFVKYASGTTEAIHLNNVTSFTLSEDAELCLSIHPASSPNIKGTAKNLADIAMCMGNDQPATNYDFNDLATGERYQYVSIGSNTINAPMASGSVGLLINAHTPSDPRFQIFLSHTGFYFIRYKTGGTWSSWRGLLSETLRMNSTSPSDMNNAPDNSVCMLYQTNVSNSPVPNPFGVLITYKMASGPKAQEYIDFDSGEQYSRVWNGTNWRSWKNASGKTVIRVASSDDLYTKLSSIPQNSHVIIEPGTYDISSHLSDSYDFDIAPGNGSIIEGIGMPTIICESESKLTYPSIIRMPTGNCTVKGINFIGTNIRYIIHDDQVASSGCEHIVSDCNFTYTGTPGSTAAAGRSYGAGTSNNSHHIIENCYFIDTNDYAINFHTPSSTEQTPPVQPTAPAHVRISNCAIPGASIGLNSLPNDAGEDRDIYLISNCLLDAAIHLSGSDAIKLVSWNNEVI